MLYQTVLREQIYVLYYMYIADNGGDGDTSSGLIVQYCCHSK